MNITLRQLEYLKALVQHRNFRRAAETCHVSQPALSVQIKALEQAFGGPLVERLSRDVIPTPLGRRVLDVAGRMLADLAELDQIARSGQGGGGSLTLGVIPTIAPYFLPDALAALRARDIALDVQVTEAKTARLARMLGEGTLDVAVMALPVEADRLTAVPLFEDRFLLAGSAARLAQIDRSDPLTPDRLNLRHLMLLEDGHCLTDQALEVCGQGRGHPQINMGASSLSTLSRLVAAGFGVTLMPELAALSEAQAAPEMRLCRFSTPEPARVIGLFRRDTGPQPEWFGDLQALLTGVGEKLVQKARDDLSQG